MLVRGAPAARRRDQAVGGSSAHGYVQGATALKGDLAEPAPLTIGGVAFAPAADAGRRQAGRSADEGLCRRSLPGMREFHDGAQRDVLEVRHVRGDDGVLVVGITVTAYKIPIYPRPSLAPS